MRDYLLTTDITGKYVVRTLMGFNTLVKPSDVQNIIKDLKEYCKNYTDEEVDLINTNIKDTFFDFKTVNEESQLKKQLNGYVYLLQCDEFYKIGYSKDVEQRIRQLDVRPYKIKLLKVWESDIAYSIEQELHKCYKSYRVDNEWYSSELPIYTLDKTIKELEAKL